MTSATRRARCATHVSWQRRRPPHDEHPTPDEDRTDMSPGSEPDHTILTVTEEALRTVLEVRAEEDDASGLALWLEISGVGGTEYQYDLYFETPADAGADDTVLSL